MRDDHALDELAASNLLQYLDEQAEATGVVPDDRTVVVERFRDEIGDWRICILSPFGTPVHAPWAMAIERRLADHYDMPVESMWGDDGIVLRLPEAADELPPEIIGIDPDDIEDLVVSALPQTALFSSRFRECAGRSLLLPRRRPDQRTPLWQQRQRAADLLAVAAKYPTFPVLLEASRECLQDVFDVPALRDVLGQLRSRAVRVVTVETSKPSPMAQSLLFNWIAAYMYEGDAPLAERRAAALALDRDLLADLLGAEELRELLDPGVLADVELDVQHLSDGRRARTADELHDVLRRVGDLTATEVELRCEPQRGRTAGRCWRRSSPSGERSRSRSPTRRASSPPRTPPATATPSDAPCRWVCRRRSPSRCRAARGARRPLRPDARSLRRARRGHSLRAVGIAGRRRAGRAGAGWTHRPRGVPPEGVRREWCDVEILRQLRRRSLAALAGRSSRSSPWRSPSSCRRGRGCPARRGGGWKRWSRRSACSRRAAGGVDAGDRRAPARVDGYRASMLDELCTSGDVVWLGAGAIGSNDGRIRVCFADQVALLAPSWDASIRPTGALHETVRELLAGGGASFWTQLRAGAVGPTDAELLAALWDLVWAGEVTNDSLAALRAMAPARARRLAGRGVPACAPGTAVAAGPDRARLRCGALEPRRSADGATTNRHRVGPRHRDAAGRTPRGRGS